MEESGTKNNYSKAEKDMLFEGEFMPHLNALYNFAYKLTYNEDDAQDLVQDTYMKAHRFINSFHKGTNAKLGCLEF